METISQKQENKKLFGTLSTFVSDRINEFENISEERKAILGKLTGFISSNIEKNKPTNLTFICTHNSRRSHMSQLWAQVAAYYYGIENVSCFSGGTEVTAFNSRSVKALQKAGFHIEKTKEGENPLFEVTFAENADPILAFSKKYGHEINPKENFAAVMTCSHADENCPIVHGASQKISVMYEDPKVADDTPLEESKYEERSKQIASEMLYAFSQIKS